MRAILDTSVLIASERQRQSCTDLVKLLREMLDLQQAATSVISIVELTHGIYRARTAEQRLRRQIFVEDVLDAFNSYPVTTEVAQRADQIEGEQAALEVAVDTADLLIGATALEAGFSVLTLNRRHFKRIPGLVVVPLTLTC